ncbi:MAG: universal stress protein [Saprospiraceae bacterium]|nr:universal stress protein [Saprospiraceae bacterium]
MSAWLSLCALFVNQRIVNMKKFDRSLVALDLSGMDKNLLRYFSFMSPLLDTKRAYFVHIIPDFSLPKDIDVEFHKLFSTDYPIDEKIEDKLSLDVAEVLNGHAFETRVDVIEGKPYEKLMHWAEVKAIDLLVVGHKEKSEGSGITVRRVARKADYNLLFVPEKAQPKLRDVVVPIDFSENSLRALQVALRLQERTDEINIRVVYVVEMPPSDYYMRPAESGGFRAVLVDSAKTAYRNFLNEYGIDGTRLEPVFLENDYGNTAVRIDEYLRTQPADLLIMGAQGHTAFESFVFGSVTERLLERCTRLPILVIR